MGYVRPHKPSIGEYIIRKEGTNIQCINGSTGNIETSGTDATTIIQHAIDLVTTGGTVYIKKGVYTLTGGLTVAGSCWLRGDGWHNTDNYGTMLFLGNSVDETMISVASGTRINRFTIQDLVIDGNSVNNASGHGIHLQSDTHEAYFCNVGVFSVKDRGIYNQSALYTNINNCTIEYCGGGGVYSGSSTFLNSCILVGNYYGFVGASGGSSMFLNNCVIAQNDRYGILSQTDLHATNCIIYNNSDASAGTYSGIHHSSANELALMNSKVTGSSHKYQVEAATGVQSTIIIGNFFNAGGTGTIRDVDGNAIIENNTGYVTQNGGAAGSTADGGTIAHGCDMTPTSATVAASVAGEIATVTSIDASNITVAIKTHAGAAGTSQTIYWRAFR